MDKELKALLETASDELEDAAQAQASILGRNLSKVPVLRPDQKENAG